MKFEIDVNIKHSSDPKIEQILGLLAQILGKEDQIMSLASDIMDLLGRVDTATSNIAARIQKLVDQIAAGGSSGGISASDASAIADKLAVEVASLEQMGKDPNNPV